MPLRALLRYFLNNEYLTQKVAESYPVRRAAQLAAYIFHRGKELGDESIDRLRDSNVVQRIRQESQRTSSFTRTFSKEMQQGMKDINDKIKKDR